MHTAQRERLMRAFHNEPARPLGTVLKCGAGLAVLALLAAIGASTAHRGGMSPDAPVTAGSPATKAGTAEAHRKQLFDARRVRFTDDAPRARQADPSMLSATEYAAP